LHIIRKPATYEKVPCILIPDTFRSGILVYHIHAFQEQNDNYGNVPIKFYLLKQKNMRFLFSMMSFMISATSMGQTISKFLVNDYKISDTTITEIIESKTYIEPSKTSTYEKTYHYNNKGFLTLRVGLDQERKLSSRISYDYNENGDLVFLREELWNHSMGYSVTTTKFIFNSSGLKAIQILGPRGELQYKSHVTCENGFPISISTYNHDSLLIGSEVAGYDFTKNKVSINVFNNKGNQFGKTIELNVNINHQKDFKLDEVVYDNYGEIIKEIKHKCYACDELVTCDYKYKYDKHHHWIKKVTYVDEGSGPKKTEISTRTITYRK
jgi:hypothetical protein